MFKSQTPKRMIQSKDVTSTVEIINLTCGHDKMNMENGVNRTCIFLKDHNL